MHRRPITPAAHGAIDYAFAALNALAPTLFGLTGPARAICYGMAASQGVLNALTDQPLALAKVVPFRLHGEGETLFVPSILLLPLLTGAMKRRNARIYFGAFFALAAANYVLTDYNAHEPLAPLPTGQKVVEWAEAAMA